LIILDKIIPIYEHIPFTKKDKKIKMGKHSQSGNILWTVHTFNSPQRCDSKNLPANSILFAKRRLAEGEASRF
jgi:hypothetical protein